MKKRNLVTTIVWSGFLLTVLFGKTLSTTSSLNRAMDDAAGGDGPTISVLNINNMASWIYKNGAGTTSGSPNGEQVDYPIFTGGLIYEDGMLWGVKSSEYSADSPIRVGGSTYYHGTKAGRVIYNADGTVAGSTDPTTTHVWRVRRDYATGDLSKDATNYCFNAGDDCDEASVRAQYAHDWENWPAAWGAPYDDVDGNGSYNPATDIPGYPGADQTLWTISNDVPEIVTDDGSAVLDDDGSPKTSNTSPQLYGADPVGVELQVTMWAYAFGASDPLGNIHFKRARLIYTGLVDGSSFGTSPATLDTVYFTQWSDPDLGTYTDDYVGCDIDLSFGYVYNGNRLDGVFNGIYNLPCPAGGYDFLQGPVTAAGDTLGMTSFTYFGAGSSISDPDLSSYNGSLQFFNLMEGFLPRPEYPVQIPWTDLSTGEITNFALSGDPVTGSGWVDGVQLPPGDRRLVMASGPFVMNLGDTANVVFALAAGIGLDAVSSVSVAKFVDSYAQFAYDNKFNLPSAPTSPSVTAIEMDGMIALDWGSSSNAVSSTEETVSAGFEFEGYNVYQLPGAGSPLSEGVKVATFDKINVIQNILDPAVDPLTGLVVEVAKQTGTNSGVQRYYETDYDEIRGRPMSNGVGYHFAVTAYSFLADNEGSPFKTLESADVRVTVVPHDANPGVTTPSSHGEAVTVTHTGTANAAVEVTVVNPSDLTGDSYEVNFSEQAYSLGLDGSWTAIGGAGKVNDMSGSDITGAAETSYDVGTIDVVLQIDVVSPDYNYAGGVHLTFPEGTVINEAYEADDGVMAMVSGNEVMLGDSSAVVYGFFAGGEVVYVNINTPADFPNTPINIAWTIFDDGWAQWWCAPTEEGGGGMCETCVAYGIGEDCDGNVLSSRVNATGTAVVDSLSYYIQTEKHWNLMKGSTYLLEKQTFVGGVDIFDGGSAEGMSALHYNNAAAVTVEGFQVNVSGGYAAPSDAFDHDYSNADGDYDIDSYAQNGWALTAMAVDPAIWGTGFADVDHLQRDVLLVYDGVLGEPDATTGFIPVASGGSQVWIWGARGGDLANHPSPEAPGTSAPFLITVPFKVYDLEPDGGGDPVQISIIIYDRIQASAAGYDGSYDGNGDGVPEYHAFNPYNRMYTEFVLRPYEETLAAFDSEDANSNLNYLTWNAVWWDADFVTGDEVVFNYANPIQTGVDKFTFSTQAMSTTASNDVSGVNVYPNPYYGFHELETSRKAKYVSFNHLPQEATIDIYTMGGTYVCRLDKNDASQFATWDLNNQYGYPVASGLYIVRVTSGGEEKILKFALVQETQVLKYY